MPLLSKLTLNNKYTCFGGGEFLRGRGWAVVVFLKGRAIYIVALMMMANGQSRSAALNGESRANGQKKDRRNIHSQREAAAEKNFMVIFNGATPPKLPPSVPSLDGHLVSALRKTIAQQQRERPRWTMNILSVAKLHSFSVSRQSYGLGDEWI